MSAKQITRREFLRGAALTGVGLAAAACAPSLTPTVAPIANPTVTSTPSGPRTGGILRLAAPTEGASLGFPPTLSVVYGNRQIAPAVETLYRTDKTGKPIPWLVSSESGDVAGKALTLSLRKGIKFHDGTDFNAEAVRWNLEQYMAAKSGGTEKFKSIDAVDEYTVRINMTEWDNTVTGNFTYMIGMIVSPSAFKKNGKDWAVNNPVGTGPFKFVKWEKDVRTTYEKFDGYWQKGKPYLEGIQNMPIPDSVTRLLSLKKGEVDLLVGINPKDLADLKAAGYVVSATTVGAGVVILAPDSANPNSPFADIRVRQAAQHSIDTDAIAKTVLLGQGEASNQWAYKGHWAYNTSVVGYPFNPTKAKQLLAEAGHANGFQTKIAYHGSSAETEPIMLAVQGYLKAVGIDVALDKMQTARWNEVAVGGGKWEGLLWAGVVTNPDVAAGLAGRYVGGGKYFSQTAIPEDYAKAVRNAVTAPDFETKQKYTQEALKLMTDKHATLITLVSKMDFVASPSYVLNHGFMATPNSAWWTPDETWMNKV